MGASANANASPSPTPSASTNAPVAASASAATPSADVSRKGTHVVHVGDSFTHAHFWQNLAPRFKAVGARYEVNARTATYTTTWASDEGLDKLLWAKPQLVLITLGANEFEMPDAKEHAPAVQRLAKKVSKNASCVWIPPPSWKKDTGILKVIRDNCAPCLYFDSDAEVPNIERKNDGIHPNEAGGAKWAARFWEWLEEHRDPSRGPWALKADATKADAPAQPPAQP